MFFKGEMFLNYAGFWKRFLARIIDILIYLPFLLINYVMFESVNKNIFLNTSLLITILVLLYNVLFVYFIGRTPGKMIVKLKVIKTDGNKVGLSNSILRETFSIMSLLITIVQQFKVFGEISYINNIGFAFMILSLLDYLMYLFSSRCKTIHDYLADTVVIDELSK
jgi:uncharacterized RDD family membrane protein YckC